MPGKTFEPYEVVVVPFPFTEQAAAKRRPALVVSTRAFNDRHDHLVLTMITSALHGPWPSDVRLGDWRAAGLTAPCVVRFKVFTLDVSLLIGRVAALANTDRNAVQRVLTKSMAFC